MTSKINLQGWISHNTKATKREPSNYALVMISPYKQREKHFLPWFAKRGIKKKKRALGEISTTISKQIKRLLFFFNDHILESV